jgi:hypothetical protein
MRAGKSRRAGVLRARKSRLTIGRGSRRRRRRRRRGDLVRPLPCDRTRRRCERLLTSGSRKVGRRTLLPSRNLWRLNRVGRRRRRHRRWSRRGWVALQHRTGRVAEVWVRLRLQLRLCGLLQAVVLLCLLVGAVGCRLGGSLRRRVGRLRRHRGRIVPRSSALRSPYRRWSIYGRRLTVPDGVLGGEGSVRLTRGGGKSRLRRCV